MTLLKVHCELATPLIIVEDYILIDWMSDLQCDIHSAWRGIENPFLDICKYLSSSMVHYKKAILFLTG